MADLSKYVGGSGKTVKLHDQRVLVKEAGVDELHELLEDVQPELLNLKTQAMLQQVPNPMRIRQIKKLVARVRTELNTRGVA